MYEQYTDKQIVEMLVPKLKKAVPSVDWNMVIANAGRNRRIIQAIGFVYRSAYIRGQLGRSFIIGEPKQTEHWVPATRDNVKAGNKVRMIDSEVHNTDRYWFPVVGTSGIVKEIDYNNCLVQWPKGTTSGKSKWWCNYYRLEVLLCE